MTLKSSLTLSISSVRSGSSARTASPRVNVASKPNVPAAVWMGIRSRSDVRVVKESGSSVGGGVSGRNPLGIDTVNGGRAARSFSDVGMVVRSGKVDAGADESILVSLGHPESHGF